MGKRTREIPANTIAGQKVPIGEKISGTHNIRKGEKGMVEGLNGEPHILHKPTWDGKSKNKEKTRE